MDTNRRSDNQRTDVDLGIAPFAHVVSTADYRWDYPNVPPVPDIPPCLIYPARRLYPDMSDGEFVFAWVSAYTTTVNYYAKERGVPFSYTLASLYKKLKQDKNKEIKGIDKKKFDTILSFRPFAFEKSLRPVSWMAYSVIAWFFRGKHQVPPLNVIFPKDPKPRQAIYGIYTSGFRMADTFVTHAHCEASKRLKYLHLHMRQDLMRLKNPSREQVADVVNQYFPGDSYRQLVAEATNTNMYWAEKLRDDNRRYFFTPGFLHV